MPPWSRAGWESPSTCPEASSFQVEVLEVVDEQRVFDGFEDKADVLCVCGAGEMRVQRLVAFQVQILVHLQEEFFRSLSIALRACRGGGERGIKEVGIREYLCMFSRRIDEQRLA